MKVPKIIKKTGRWLWRIFLVLLVLLVTLYFLVQMPSVQTYLCQKAASYLSKELKTKVEVSSVNIGFIKKLVVGGLYIEDLHHDTLLYVEELKVDIDKFDYGKQQVFISDITLSSGLIEIVRYANDSDLNFQFVKDYFRDKDTTAKDTSAGWLVELGDIVLMDFNFAFRDERFTDTSRGIDFDDIRCSDIDARLFGLQSNEDTISVKIKDFACREKSGFVLRKLTADALLSPVFTRLDNLVIHTNESVIETDLLFKHKDYEDYDDFVHKVRMKAVFDSSLVQMNDIGYFAPELKGLDRKIFLSGEVSGRVDDLKGKNMNLVIGKETHFRGDFAMTGLPDIEETYLNFNIEELSTTKKDVEEIPLPPYTERNFVKLSANMANLGRVKYKGKIDGYYYSLVANGTFNTALGMIVSDIHLNQDESGEFSYRGRLRTNNFDIGQIVINDKYLGRITMDAQVNGRGLKLETMKANLERCDIASLEYNDYTYTNITAKGSLARRIFNGELLIKDENVDLGFSGDVNFSKSPTTMNFSAQVNKMNLVPMNLIKGDKKVSVATSMTVQLKANNLDDATGSVVLLNTAYFQDKELYVIDKLTLTASDYPGGRTIDLKSDFADANMSGKFTLQDIAASFRESVEEYLPALKGQQLAKDKPKKPKKKEGPPEQKFTYSVLLKDTRGITKIFLPDIRISPNTALKGNYDSKLNDFTLKGNSDSVGVGGTELKSLVLDGATRNSRFEFQANCLRYILSDTIWMDNVLLESRTQKDTIHFDFSWINQGLKKNLGEFGAFVSFREMPRVELKFIHSKFFLSDSSWTISKSNMIVFDTAHVLIKDFMLSNKSQLLNVWGVISENPADKLNIQLDKFNLGNINIITSAFNLNFRGIVSGNSDIANLYKPENLIYSANLDFKDFKINSEDIGSGSVVSIYDKKKDAISLNGTFSKGTIPNFEFSGYYFPTREKDNLDLTATIKNFKLVFFEPFVKEVCETFRGFVSAELKIQGELSRPRITGMADVQAKNIHMNYLNTNYSLTDAKVSIEPNSFGVENMIVNDMNGNTCIVTGKVYHDNFRNFQLDIDVQANKFLCLSTTEKDNSLYYGTAFMTGIVNFSGFVDDVIRIDASVKTDKAFAIDPKTGIKKMRYTQFNIPLSGTEEVSESDFITFVKKDTGLVKLEPRDYKVNLSGILLNLELEATTDAEVQLIFDEKVGDVIRAKGNGNILMSINTNGNFTMYGEYQLEDGDYLFTLQNVINKKFRIEKGSTVKWSGDPYDAVADIKAIYEVRTSLKPFFPNDSSSKYAKRYPVDCILNMKGKLMNPDITFDIDLPTVDSQDREEVLKYMKSEQEMNKQVFALLVLNSFVAPSQENTQNNYVGQAVESTSSDLLSNQLSNWLSQISNDFDIGVHYRPGDYVSKDEVELALSTQLFNDKLSIDGSVSNNANNSQSANNVVGDVTAEYKVSDDGKFRVKAFNKANDNTVIETDAAYTQGIGVFYREEFNTIGELYRRYLQKIRKKDDEPAPAP
ncbi:MAG: translocation/assembly module TamB domain-containing protein [Bacteroidota bacterium]